MRIDRNSASPNRLRRNFQRLDVGTATAQISIASTSGNLISKTSTGGYEVVIPATNTLYVDVNGNDSTAKPNFVGLPYQNISTALAIAGTMAPATVYVGPGTFNLGSSNFVGSDTLTQNPSGVNIIGAGNCRGDKARGGTIFISNRPYYSGRVCVPGNDVYYADFYIEGSTGVNTSTTLTATACIGFLNAPDLPGNNVILDNVGAFGARAGIACAMSTASTSTNLNWLLFNCWLMGNMDAINSHNFFGAASNIHTWWNLSTYDCVIIGTDPGNASTSANTFVAGVNFTQGGMWLDNGSYITAIEQASTVSTVPTSVITSANTFTELHGSVLSASTFGSTGSLHVLVTLNGSTTIDIGTSYNPLSTSTVNAGSVLIMPFYSTGDLLTVASTGAFVPIHVGTQGQVLTVNSTTSTGLAWSTGSGSGSISTLISTGDLLTFGSTGSTTRLPVGSAYSVLTSVPSTASSTDLQWKSTICYSTGSTSLNYQFGQAADGSEEISLDWNNRVLYDTIGNVAARWGFYQLLDNSGILSENWTNRLLYDGNTTSSIDWGNRLLLAPGGSTTIFCWSTAYSAGDLLVAASTTGHGFQRLSIGTQGQVLVVNSTLSQSTNWRQLSTADVYGAIGSTGVFPVFASDPTLASTQIGQAWYNSTQFNAKVLAASDAAGNQLIEIPGGTLLASAQSNGVYASTGPTTLPTTVYTFPNGFINQQDRVMQFFGSFVANATSLANGWTVTFNIANASFTMYTTGNITTGNSETFIVQGLIGIRSTGSTGRLYYSFSINGQNTATGPFATFNATSVSVSTLGAAQMSISVTPTNSTSTAANDTMTLSVYSWQIYQ